MDLRRDVPAAGAIAALSRAHSAKAGTGFGIRIRAIITAAHGLFRPATHQRHCARLDLWPDRDRLHDGLRHRRHDQFRPWRHFHDRRLYRADLVPDPGFDRPYRGSGDTVDRVAGVDGDHGVVWL